jgi:hypothetical protein
VEGFGLVVIRPECEKGEMEDARLPYEGALRKACKLPNSRRKIFSEHSACAGTACELQ